MKIVVVALLLSACGTYSHLRVADNLRAGGVELSGGLAVSTVPEVVPVAQVAVGITDWVEVQGQYEVYSALGELRFGILSSARHGVALAIGAGGGVASLWEELGDAFLRDGAVLGDVVLGRRWDGVEIYVSDRALVLVSTGYVINAAKAGVRARFRGVHLGLEGGVTTHHSFFALGEGTAYLGFGL